MVQGRIIVAWERCKGCRICAEFCPQGVIGFADTFNAAGYRPARLVDPRGACTGCAICALVCPEAAVTVLRTRPEPAVRHAVPALE